MSHGITTKNKINYDFGVKTNQHSKCTMALYRQALLKNYSSPS